MDLMPDDIRAKLLANGAAAAEREANGRGLETDDVPVVKFFGRAATWLITEMKPDGDTLFGLCDMGMDCVELGHISLGELQSLSRRPVHPVERDLYFAPRYPMSVYIEAARSGRRITTESDALDKAAAATSHEKESTP